MTGTSDANGWAGAPYSIYDLLRQGAASLDPRPGIGWPRYEDSSILDEYSTLQLYQQCETTAHQLLNSGFECIPYDKTEVVALLGPASFEFVVTLFSLSRLGYTILLITPRQMGLALSATLEQGGATTLFYPPSTAAAAYEAAKSRPVKLVPFMSPGHVQIPLEKPLPSAVGFSICKNLLDKTAIVWHTSGSTGLPKLFPMSHREMLARSNLLDAGRLTGAELTTSTPYNPVGMLCLLKSMRSPIITYFWNEQSLYTTENLVKVMKSTKAKKVGLYPHALVRLAGSARGIELLAQCQHVSTFGSPLPNSIGNLLIENGVKLRIVYAMTETSKLMYYDHSFGDREWAYLAPMPSKKQYIDMAPTDQNGLFEAVVLKGCPHCNVSNSDDGSYHTRDLFKAHPLLPDRWRFVGRMDDRIPMANANHVVPLDFEANVKGNVKCHKLIKEAVVFGMGMLSLGLLVFRGENSRCYSDKELLSAVWPAIEEANAMVPPAQRIRQQLIVLVGADRAYPRTDKGTFIRSKVYREFEEEIGMAYRDVGEYF